MTPQQKADELIKRFWDNHKIRVMKPAAIQCAIICVEDKIKENISILEMLILHGTERTRMPIITRLDELQSVLNELKSRL